jgi:DNA-binding CsgD family transcriptional regulator
MNAPAEKTSTRGTLPASASADRDAETSTRHTSAVYQQALLMLGDENLAGQVARDVIAGACTRPAASPGHADVASRELAVSVLRRCQELMAGPARQYRASRRRPARGGAGSQGLDGRERAVLGLVTFGGLDYREAARELKISPSRAAALLRAALITLAGLPVPPSRAAVR